LKRLEVNEEEEENLSGSESAEALAEPFEPRFFAEGLSSLFRGLGLGGWGLGVRSFFRSRREQLEIC